MFSKHRLEALSDAVFAIAMTLLILDIKVPVDIGTASLGDALRQQRHEWISFAVSFGIASLFWTFQHRVFDVLDEVGHQSTLLTFVTLAFVTTLPFSTALWGHHIAQPLACFIYFGNQFLIALALTIKLEVAHHLRHLQPGRKFSLLRLRLWIVCCLMGSAAVAATLIPIRLLFLVPLVFGLSGRYLRARAAHRWDRLEANHIASTPIGSHLSTIPHPQTAAHPPHP